MVPAGRVEACLMNPARTLDRHATEELNRVDWWLRETGDFPPTYQLRRIRSYRRWLTRRARVS